MPTQLSTQYAVEPPVAPWSIPLIGHTFGLLCWGSSYFVHLSHQVQAPIFIVKVPGQKLYIIKDLEHNQLVLKQHRQLPFAKAITDFSIVICGIGASGRHAYSTNGGGDQSRLFQDGHDAIHAALRPGQGLDNMNRSMLKELAVGLEEIKPMEDGRNIQLWHWMRALVTTATSNANWGPMNPYRDPAIQEAFWTFQHGIVPILTMPSILVRTSIQAREKVVRALTKYCEEGYFKQASDLTKWRYESSLSNGVTDEDAARIDLGQSIAVLGNTPTGAYWLLLLIFATPGVLEEVRQEIDAVTISSFTETGARQRTLDVAALKTKCPSLLSVYQETLRWRSLSSPFREVVEDTVLNGWLLKSGSMIQMPSRIIHANESLWGADAEEFNPWRFMPDSDRASAKKARISDVRTFGGGKTLCPGRHFATNEILMVVALFVSRYEMCPTSGAWQIPSTKKSNPAGGMMEPDMDIDVRIKCRAGYEDTTWEAVLQTSNDILAVVAEDQLGSGGNIKGKN